MDHKELCALAVAWLKRPMSRGGPGCNLAISETANSVNGEIPDAIGWRPFNAAYACSVVVEVKVSRSDFLNDAAKPHRKTPGQGMGTFRYFMAPAGLVAIDELPGKWGLIEVTPRGHLKLRAGHLIASPLGQPRPPVDIWRHEYNLLAEISTLAMCLNRVGDPQRYQERMRELSNINARLVRRNEELSRRNQVLSHELFMLKHDEKAKESATPRKVRA